MKCSLAVSEKARCDKSLVLVTNITMTNNVHVLIYSDKTAVSET